MEDVRRVADYFVIAGLPENKDELKLLDEYSLEVNLKPSAYQDPITDITVIFPGLGENVPDYYQLIDATPTGLSANLNHGSLRAPDVFLCFRRGRDRAPLVDLGVLYDGKERVMPDSQVVEFTPGNHSANVNNTNNSSTFLTYRRASDMSPCNELVVMDVCVIVTSKGEEPPHSFCKIDKTLNKGMVGADVYICYKKSMNRADLISYKPSLLSRMPLKNNPAYALEETVALFCLPMGANLECWPANSARSNSVQSSFVLTLANRSKVYGSAITFYEEYEEELTVEQQKGLQLHKYRRAADRKIFSNKCICILSQWPFFEAFENFLFFLHKRQLMGPHDVPLERFVSHFIHDVPFPSPARPRILLQLDAELQIALFQPEELPLPRSGASFTQLLTNLGPDNCLLVLLLALTEQKILIHSLRPAVLTSVAEAVMQIIFPFYWQCPYIPLCPIGMSDYLAAPLPFIMGLDSRFFDLYDQPTDVNAVDLDTSTVTVCEEKRGALTSKILPKRASRLLRARLAALQEKCWLTQNAARKLEAHNDGSLDFNFKLKKREMQLDLEIREVFLHFMTSILDGYRAFLLPITSEPTVGATDVQNLFDQDQFLRTRDRNFHRFYGMLMKTQLFTKFIEERSFVSDTNTCLAFFDECVERTQHEERPRFLELEGFDSDRTVFILPPEPTEEEIREKKVFKTEKFQLKDELFPDPPEEEETDTDATTGDGSSDGRERKTSNALDPILQTPVSNLAKRTKQEIRSAQKTARHNQRIPYLWAKCLINTAYSLWFIHLPGYLLANEHKSKSLRLGVTQLQRMHRLRLHPADEICYRVMMQLCGLYNSPALAVKVLTEMQTVGLHMNAVTYGYYNKAVLESEWRSGEVTPGQLRWNKLRLVLRGITLFKESRRRRLQRFERMRSDSSNAVNNPEVSEVDQQQVDEKEEKKADNLDGVSQASSDVSNEAVLGAAKTKANEAVDDKESSDNKSVDTVKEENKVNGDEKQEERGNEVAEKEGEKTDEKQVPETGDGEESMKASIEENEEEMKKRRQQFRKRVRSIVKPAGSGLASDDEERDSRGVEEEEEEDGDEAEKPENAVEEEFLPTKEDTTPSKSRKTQDDVKRRLSFNSPEMASIAEASNKEKLVSSPSTEIPRHHKSIHFEHQPDDLGVTSLQDIKLDSLGADKRLLESSRQEHQLREEDEDELDKAETDGKPQVAKYSEIRGRFSSLFNSKSVDHDHSATKKVNRSLFESTELEEDARDFNEEGKKGHRRGASEGMSEDNNSKSQSIDSLEQMESMPSSPSSTKLGKLPPVHEHQFLTPPPHQQQQEQGHLFKVGSSSSIRSNLVGTPVTQNDPLGALSNDPSPVNSLPKSATMGSYASSTSNLKVEDNILGTPFEDKMARSQTLPVDQMDGGGSLSSSFSSFKNLTKSGMGNRLNSLKKNSSNYLANYLSPNAATTAKKTQEALTSIKSAYSSAATVVSKRVGEIKESVSSADGVGVSPAVSSQFLSGKDDVDSVSIASNDSRRPSTVDGPYNDQSETWSTFTGSLWDQLWGTSGDPSYHKGGQQQQRLPRVSDISEQYESLYSKLPRRPPGPVAMEIQMTTCSRCRYCHGILFDEEIMSGWTAEDSNLNTKCCFCDRKVVPFLTCRVIDFRTRPRDGADSESEQLPPSISDYITVPYLCPLVLRKELENMLDTEGDSCLLDPAGIDSHPIIFWNLMWFFERIAVKSHLPGLCLQAPSLAKDTSKYDPSWADADHRNVYLQCRWDNERLHETSEPPLYTLWQKQQLSLSSPQRTVAGGAQPKEHQELMQQIIGGVQVNDLLQPIKTMLDRRLASQAPSSNSTPATPTTPTSDAFCPKTPRSIYREVLFLTLVSLGQDNIDLTAFDREYRRAFEKLPAKYELEAHRCDKPPSATTGICRRLFRDLKL